MRKLPGCCAPCSSEESSGHSPRAPANSLLARRTASAYTAVMIQDYAINTRRQLHWVLVALCTIVILAATTPCAMALAEIPDAADNVHDCPHCPPEPCHELGSPDNCDRLNPADKPRSDSDADKAALLTPFRIATRERPTRLPTHAIGPPPARDGPRRHLILVTFNE